MAATENVGFSETDAQKPAIALSPPKRVDVLLALWKRTVWLDGLIDKLEKNEIQPSEKVKSMVYDCQVYGQLAKTVLWGLKDETIEIRVLELEEKIGKGFVIEQNRETA